MINGKSNRPCDGVAVGDVFDYKDLQNGVKIARGEKIEKNLSPMRKAMLEQFGYVHKSLIDKVVI